MILGQCLGLYHLPVKLGTLSTPLLKGAAFTANRAVSLFLRHHLKHPLVPRTGRRRTQGQTTATVCRLGVGGFLMSADISVYFVFADSTTVSWGLCLPVWTGLLSWREESLFFCVYYVHPRWYSVDCLLLLPVLFLYSEEWHNKARLVKRSFRVNWGAHVLQKHGLFSRKKYPGLSDMCIFLKIVFVCVYIVDFQCWLVSGIAKHIYTYVHIYVYVYICFSQVIFHYGLLLAIKYSLWYSVICSRSLIFVYFIYSSVHLLFRNS